MSKLVRCRAKMSQHCLDGREDRSEDGWQDDGTYRTDEQGGSVICDPCYIALMPFSHSGSMLLEEEDAAMAAARAAGLGS